MSLFKRLLSAGEKAREREIRDVVARVNELADRYAAMSDDELVAESARLRERRAAGEDWKALEAEAYALVRETAAREIGLRPFDVQVFGAAVLSRGMVAEMKTGEGKTLVATMPSYLEGISGRGIHVVTTNDYLAKRDAEWMGRIHRRLGLEVGLIQAQDSPATRRKAYAADITYGTNNEFGFDYLRDHLALTPQGRVQRELNFALVDEVDSILIDEARTPLIISGQVSGEVETYKTFAKLAGRLQRDVHYEVDEVKQQVLVTEEGVAATERALAIPNLYAAEGVDLVHHLESALRAKELFHRDHHYIVEDGEVKIVDEFTGRILEGRRYSEGLHQAIEAKEGVAIKEETRTLATVTLQNYFRLYDKLAGMTGTAMTEAAEFASIYGLEVMEIPTNRPVARIDHDDVIYKTEAAKWRAVVADIKERHEKGQPVLVGTVTIETSEKLSEMLKREGIPHEVLNAKNHTREAEIIAQAGRPGAVTVATNMAGRGVDIQLGGNAEALAEKELRREGLEPWDEEWPARLAEAVAKYEAQVAEDREKVLAAGGLYVLGTERHESRRIDNQLRGRSGRQGDPGESRFYLSGEDELVYRFAGDRFTRLMELLKLPEDLPIENKRVSNAIERAQRQVESQNFEIRKNILEYDEVINAQRQAVYDWRDRLLDGDDEESVRDLVHEWIEALAQAVDATYVAEGEEAAEAEIAKLTPKPEPLLEVLRDSGDADRVDRLAEAIAAQLDERYEEFGKDAEEVARQVVLTVLDRWWTEQLTDLDDLRSSVGLRGVAGTDPLAEYKREAFELFEGLVEGVRYDAVRYLLHTQKVEVSQARRQKALARQAQNKAEAERLAGGKVGRNEPCPCGSGKKYKRCHGAPVAA